MPREPRRRPITDLLQKKLGDLPAEPGCYIYRDESAAILYVGKAINLRNRVRSYFQASTKHGSRIERMVGKIRDIEWISVTTELEALVLECNLIKEHRPPYNVRLRDDKSYPYIVITKEAFPRVLFTRRLRKDGAKYFGPYTNSYAVRDTLKLLHKNFPLIPCGKSWTGNRDQRPCLYYHMNQCLAPCAGLAKIEDYRVILGKVERFLQGKEDDLLVELQAEMNEAAEALDFENAARIRDQIIAVHKVQERQKVMSQDQEDRDVVAVVKDDRGAAVQILYIRHGKLIGQRQFILDGSSETSPGEAVQEFVKQYYSDSIDVPKEILLPVEIAERDIVQTWLRQKRGSAVTIAVPQGGEGLKLVDLAAQNAEHALSSFRKEIEQKEAWVEDALTSLQDALDLPEPPTRIEGYDISNIQGTAPVGSMVVVENGEAANAEYRRFKVRYHPESPNDFAMMHEVITRRLRAYLDNDPKFSKLPDLIMIDGGRGQLAAALKARDQLGLTVPMVGLAKKLELIVYPTKVRDVELSDQGLDRYGSYGYDEGRESGYDFKDIELPLHSPGLLLLRRLRDEAHRFAISFHRKLRDKRANGSVLDEIPGVGPRRRRMLLRSFGSIDAIRRATPEELAAVPTMTLAIAKKVANFLTEDP
jgi:excinuclease ABC subunit C